MKHFNKNAVFRKKLKAFSICLKTEVAEDSLKTTAIVDPCEIIKAASIKGAANHLLGKLDNGLIFWLIGICDIHAAVSDTRFIFPTPANQYTM